MRLEHLGSQKVLKTKTKSKQNHNTPLIRIWQRNIREAQEPIEITEEPPMTEVGTI